MTALDQLLADPFDGMPEWPDVFPNRLSPSSLSQAHRCPESWRRKYLRQEWGMSNPNFIIGQGVHGAAESNYRQKIETHEDVSLEDFLILAAESFDEKVRKDEESDGIDWEGVVPGKAKDEAVRLANAYHRVGSPLIQPVAVEEEVWGALPGLPVPVKAIVDVRTETGLWDIKTSASKPAKGKPSGDWRMRGMLYSRLVGLPFGWHVVTKTAVPGVYTPENEPGLWLDGSPVMHRLIERRVQDTVAQLVWLFNRYGPDETWPSMAPEQSQSPCGRCSFKPECAWWAA